MKRGTGLYRRAFTLASNKKECKALVDKLAETIRAENKWDVVTVQHSRLDCQKPNKTVI